MHLTTFLIAAEEIAEVVERQDELWQTRPAWIVLFAALVGVAILIALGVSLAHSAGNPTWRQNVAGLFGLLWLTPMLFGFVWLVRSHASSFVAAPSTKNPLYDPASVRFSLSPSNRPPDASSEGTLKPWVALGQRYEGGALFLPVHSDLRATEAEADEFARIHALDIVREDLRRAYGITDDVPIDLDRLHVIKDVERDASQRDLGPVATRMYRTHLLLEITDESRTEAVAQWSQSRVTLRLVHLLTFAGVLTLTWFAAATYLRLDLRTESRYRSWLRMATTALVLSGTIAAHGVLDAISQGRIPDFWS